MPNYFEAFAGIIGAVGTLAFVAAYFKSDVTKKTVAQLMELAEALEMRVNALETERDDLGDRIKHLEEENEVLRSLLDGARENTDLKEKIEKNHIELLELIEKTFKHIESLITPK